MGTSHKYHQVVKKWRFALCFPTKKSSNEKRKLHTMRAKSWKIHRSLFPTKIVVSHNGDISQIPPGCEEMKICSLFSNKKVKCWEKKVIHIPQKVVLFSPVFNPPNWLSTQAWLHGYWLLWGFCKIPILKQVFSSRPAKLTSPGSLSTSRTVHSSLELGPTTGSRSTSQHLI